MRGIERGHCGGARLRAVRRQPLKVHVQK
jgi:hypothetical protein